WRATALFYLATILSEEQRPTIMQEAIDTARQVEDTNRRVMALLTLMEALPDDLRPDIIHETMEEITK
ncbi:MAG TPA: hypothetical protein VLA72_03860, partial [Anaerolineales bacterium]|nr:hypothetical protein [Anaerolineales bacterium]